MLYSAGSAVVHCLQRASECERLAERAVESCRPGQICPNSGALAFAGGKSPISRTQGSLLGIQVAGDRSGQKRTKCSLRRCVVDMPATIHQVPLFERVDRD